MSEKRNFMAIRSEPEMLLSSEACRSTDAFRWSCCSTFIAISARTRQIKTAIEKVLKDGSVLHVFAGHMDGGTKAEMFEP